MSMETLLSCRHHLYLESLRSGWTALWCPRYQSPATEISVITRCKAFEDFFAGDCDPFKYNGLHEEITVPFSHCEKLFVGDRYSEFEHAARVYKPEMDYYTQVPDDLDFYET